MGKKRIYRTLEYSARVARLSVTSRRTVGVSLPEIEARSWTDIVIDRMIIIGLVDRDSRLPTPLMALLGALVGVLFAHVSFSALIGMLSLPMALLWIGLGLAYGYLWLGVGATAVMRIRLRRAGALA